MKLPLLYKKGKMGEVYQYSVSTEKDKIYVVTGRVGGSQIAHITECVRVNTGKTNETTPAEQAILEAKAKYKKKVKTGYVTNISGESAVLLPQKVKVYQDLLTTEKKKKNLIFPCWVEPKLDGVNGMFRLRETIELSSRGGENYEIPPHQKEPIANIMRRFCLYDLNVEQYIKGWHLQDIQSVIKKHKKGTENLVAYLFEIPHAKINYAEKIVLKKDIKEFIKTEGYEDAIQVIIPEKAESFSEIDEYYKIFVEEGYEGAIVTNSRSRYKYNVRSSDVWKYKKAKDAEFQIHSYLIDKSGHPVFVCKVEGGKTFKVKPKGTDKERKGIIEVFEDKYKNAWYKVEYETLSKGGIPLKPVGISLRKCTTDGKPAE